jgi:hypothetical protein
VERGTIVDEGVAYTSIASGISKVEKFREAFQDVRKRVR